ncbi:hypothetical protein EYF80_054490 [Liparis tanakae]|uniref:Uncharacterized protein n=1 Tax=Liparis tanakae TaxID=230148 RepID=A0A4Z2F2I9_9TELE|nr:hypothetical protein EYF80_054490 [Liparis tanakae]
MAPLTPIGLEEQQLFTFWPELAQLHGCIENLGSLVFSIQKHRFTTALHNFNTQRSNKHTTTRGRIDLMTPP